MHGNDCLRSRRNRRTDGIGIDIEAPAVRIDEHRPGLKVPNDLRRRRKCIRRNDDLIPWANSHSFEREVHRGSAGVHRYRMPRANISRELGLKLLHLRAGRDPTRSPGLPGSPSAPLHRDQEAVNGRKAVRMVTLGCLLAQSILQFPLAKHEIRDILPARRSCMIPSDPRILTNPTKKSSSVSEMKQEEREQERWYRSRHFACQRRIESGDQCSDTYSLTRSRSGHPTPANTPSQQRS